MTTVKPKKTAKKTSVSKAAAKPAKKASPKGASDARKPKWIARPSEAIGKQLKKLEAAAKKSALAEELDALVATTRPGVDFAMKKVKPEEIAGVVSRMGGDPDLPASLPWPRVNGDSLTFVAQVLVDDVKPLDDEGLLPKTGLLSFFAQLDPEAPDYGGQCFVAHFPVVTDLARILPPTSAASTADKVGLLTPKARLTLPPPEAPVITKLGLGPKDQKAYRALFDSTLPEGASHTLLGWPTASTRAGTKTRRFVAQFDSDSKLGFAVGKKNTLRFYIEGDAINARTLTTAVCTHSE